MIDDELTRRRDRLLERRLRQAHFPERKSLQDFDFSFNPTINRQRSSTWHGPFPGPETRLAGGRAAGGRQDTSDHCRWDQGGRGGIPGAVQVGFRSIRLLDTHTRKKNPDPDLNRGREALK